jgi:hypothetical protein
MKAMYARSWSRRLSYSSYAPFICSLIFLVSCSAGNFQGDGSFVDRGPLAAKDRYIVDLGTVDLTKIGQHKYSIGNLPSVPFATGLEIRESSPNVDPRKRPLHSGRVRLLLESEEGKMVFAEDAPLRDWVWTYDRGESESFLYRAGKGTGPSLDLAAGSLFVPRAGTRYRLTFEVVEPQPSARPARLLLKGGGWQ